MDLSEIIKDLEGYIEWCKDGLDADASDWGKLKALQDHNEDLKKVKLAYCKSKYEGSNAAQETLAYQDKEYQDFLDKKLKDDADFYTLNYKKTARENMIDVLRSLLSFNKGRIEQDI